MKVVGISLLSALTFVTLSCKTRTFHQGPNSGTKADPNAGGGAVSRESTVVGEFGEKWSAMRTLRDTSPAGGDSEQPAGGWWVTPIHANLLADGRVLVTGWARRDEKKCDLLGTRRYGRTFVLDPQDFSKTSLVASEKFFNVTPVNENPAKAADVLYCGGHVPLGGGKVLFAGGSTYENLGLPDGKELEYGLDYLRVYDDATKSFTRPDSKFTSGPDGMKGWSWYPTLTKLASGEVLVSNGYARCCDGRYYNFALHKVDPAKLAAGASDATRVFIPHEASFGGEENHLVAPGLRDYTHTFLLPKSVDRAGRDRDIVQAGWPGKMILLDSRDSTPQGERYYAPANASRPSGSGWDSTALLAGTGEVVTIGGTSNPPDASFADFYDPQKDTWERKDLGIGRRNSSGVLLPTGDFLVVNGEDGDRPYQGDRKRPQIVDPFSRSVTTMAPWPGDFLERGYHSWALLLKDGRVMLGGGISSNGGVGCERTDVRIFEPPYLDSAKGMRPFFRGLSEGTVLKANGSKRTFAVEGADVRAERGFALMGLGAVTHSFDQNQRYVALAHTRAANGRYVVQLPASPQVAPPGDYLLFALSEKGVPSVGAHVVVGR